jgi:hypothetical protein
MRWMHCLDEMPIAYENFKKGDLDACILPDEGYSKEEADALKKKREQKKKLKEHRELALKRSTESGDAQQSIQEKAAEELEAVEEEFETTKRILNAPPGSDFVPGLDDKNTTAYEEVDMTNRNKNEDSVTESLGTFIDAAEEELAEKKEKIGETVSMGLNAASDLLSLLQGETWTGRHNKKP